MQWSCPVKCGGTVCFVGPETWTDPDGRDREVVAGQCGGCGTEVLVRPSERAIETARARLAAMRDTMSVAARQEMLPAVSADEGMMADWRQCSVAATAEHDHQGHCWGLCLNRDTDTR